MLINLMSRTLVFLWSLINYIKNFVILIVSVLISLMHMRRLFEQRDDLCIERITLYNQLGEYRTAYNLINARKFHPWEGGEGKVTSQYVFCRVELSYACFCLR